MSKPYSRKIASLTLASLMLIPLSLLAQKSNVGGERINEVIPIVRFLLKDDISAGKVTERQAAEYFLCANDHYAAHLDPALQGKMFQPGSAISAKERAHIASLMDNAEDDCTKKLDVHVTRGKVLVRPK